MFAITYYAVRDGNLSHLISDLSGHFHIRLVDSTSLVALIQVLKLISGILFQKEGVKLVSFHISPLCLTLFEIRLNCVLIETNSKQLKNEEPFR